MMGGEVGQEGFPGIRVCTKLWRAKACLTQATGRSSLWLENRVKNGDGEVGRSDHERLYIRFKGVEISNPLSAHRKGEKEK